MENNFMETGFYLVSKLFIFIGTYLISRPIFLNNLRNVYSLTGSKSGRGLCWEELPKLQKIIAILMGYNRNSINLLLFDNLELLRLSREDELLKRKKIESPAIPFRGFIYVIFGLIIEFLVFLK